MHDKFSADVLALLPLSFNVVFEECARKHYERAPIQGQRRLLSVPVLPGSNLDFDLRFKAGKMKRMTVFIEHPAAVFFGRPAGANHSVQIDAALTFLLWLLRKEHDRCAFQKLSSRHRRGLPPLVAPIGEILHYSQLEKAGQRILTRDDYTVRFWSWAEGFLQVSPTTILESGKSVVAAVQEQLRFNSSLLPGNAKFNVDLRQRLLSNALFHCGKLKNGSDKGRIFFRGVTIFVPEMADFNAVGVLCDLLPESSEHDQPCSTQTLRGDPARRLGIQITYLDKVTNSVQSIWCQQKGEQNTKKFNSLVDFLSSEDEGYTESQPRRYLARSKIFGRSKITYTS